MPKRNSVDKSIIEGKCVSYFRAAIKSTATLDPYERRLAGFLQWYGRDCDSFVADAKSHPREAEQKLMEFIGEQKARVERKEIQPGNISNYLKAVRLLLEMNDAQMNWKKIRRTLPRSRRYAIDRIPTLEEIRTMVDKAEIRGKALTLFLLTSGMREGAIGALKVVDLVPVEQSGKIVAGKIVVYPGDEEQYVTFITPEAYGAVQDYLRFRMQHGEHLTPSSPLFRDKFDPISEVRHRKIHNTHVLEPADIGSVKEIFEERAKGNIAWETPPPNLYGWYNKFK